MSGAAAPGPAPVIDGGALLASLAELGGIGALPGGGVCRLALSDEDAAARTWVCARMHALGMATTVDAIGNLVGVYPGQDAGPPVMTGSHIDTVRTGGLYDGNFGVLAGLAAVAALRAAGHRPRRPLAVAVFSNEEGARFAPDMMGSLVYVGGLALDQALATRGIDGASVGDELARIGWAGAAPVGCPQVDSFVELHVEQGPVLHRAGLPIGVVEGVQGISWTEFTFRGQSNHAGATPMAGRRDAGLVAMQLGAFVHALTERLGGRQLGTVGRLQLQPDLVNVVPHSAVMTVDLRHTDAAALARAEAALHAEAQRLAAAQGVACSHRVLARFDPVDFDPALVALVAREADALGLPALRLPSGAGHDAQMLARVCPTAMVFVPSVDGLSHNVREHTDPAHLVQGAELLLRLLLRLADRPAGTPPGAA